MIKWLVAIFLAAILTENYILSKFLGICPVPRRFQKAQHRRRHERGGHLRHGAGHRRHLADLLPICWSPTDLAYLQTIVFILIIAALVQLVEIVLKKFIPALYQALGIYLPLITTNCAVLGVTMLVITKAEETASYGYGHVAGQRARRSGLGFMLAMVLFAGRPRAGWRPATAPAALRGLPITLIAASLVAVSFLGFQGVVDGLFA